MDANNTDYSVVADHVLEYRFATDSMHGVIHARDFTEATQMLLQMFTDESMADGGWGWVEDEEGYRVKIGNVTQ